MAVLQKAELQRREEELKKSKEAALRTQDELERLAKVRRPETVAFVWTS